MTGSGSESNHQIWSILAILVKTILEFAFKGAFEVENRKMVTVALNRKFCERFNLCELDFFKQSRMHARQPTVKESLHGGIVKDRRADVKCTLRTGGTRAESIGPRVPNIISKWP